MNDDNTGVYVIMTSNDISQLPPEFTRSGRLDATWYFGLPSFDERSSIFDIHFKKKNKIVDDSVRDLCATLSEGFTGAEIQQSVQNIIRKTFIRAKSDGNFDFIEEDIRDGISEVIPISQSSKEKIAALETYCASRCRIASEPKKATQKKKASFLDGLNF